MLQSLLKSSLFQVFLNKRIQESSKTPDNILDCEPNLIGFYVVKPIDMPKEIVYLSEFEIENKRFTRLKIHEFMFFNQIETFSFIDLS